MTTPDPKPCDDYMQSREAYDAYVQTWPEDARWQFWPVPWKVATWGERIVKIGLFFAGTAFVIVGVIAALAFFGMMMEGVGRYNSEHDRCLKNATNGYEIKQCR